MVATKAGFQPRTMAATWASAVLSVPKSPITANSTEAGAAAAAGRGPDPPGTRPNAPAASTTASTPASTPVSAPEADPRRATRRRPGVPPPASCRTVASTAAPSLMAPLPVPDPALRLVRPSPIGGSAAGLERNLNG